MINWFNKHPITSWLITIIIAIIIFYLSSNPLPIGSTQTTNIFSILYHFIAFFFLALFLLISLVQGKINKTLLLTGIILAILYGASDEFHQSFVPGRNSSFKDILTNSAGILLSGTIYSLHCLRNNNKLVKDKIVF